MTYRVKATLLHNEYDPVHIYSDEVFDSASKVDEWLASPEGFKYSQDLMVGIDVNEYLEGYRLESLTPDNDYE